MRRAVLLPLLLLPALLGACAPLIPDRPTVRAPSPERRVVLAQPRFEQFKPYDLVAAGPMTPDLASEPRAAEYRTRLREAGTKGPAYAGHLAVASWACGEGCRQWAFVDARDGRVVWGPKTGPKARFRLDSRLFVAEAAGGAPARYYIWTGKELREMEG